MASVPVLSRSEEISAVLRTEILKGQYRAGERLPSERELASRFEANRGSVREAIKRLEQLGIVCVTPGGVRIQPVEEANLDILGHLLELGEITRPEIIGQVMDVLGVMMSLSARSAVVEASDEELAELLNLCDNLINSVGVEGADESWRAFGEKLMSIHKNLVLRLVGNGLRTQFISTVMNLGIEPDIDLDAVRHSLDQLRTAIGERDGRKVRDSIIDHFNIIKTGLQQSASQPELDIRRTGNA